MSAQQIVYRVIKDYATIYSDPITMNRGDELTITEKYSEWEGWAWCTNHKTDKSGWVPEKFIDRKGDRATALVDYRAKELDATTGEKVVITETESGWAWCENESGESGWIPLEHLDKIDS